MNKKITIMFLLTRLPKKKTERRTEYFFNITICRFNLNFCYEVKELSLCHTHSNPYMFEAWWCKLLTFQTQISISNRMYSMKYLKSMTLGCKDKGIRKLDCGKNSIPFSNEIMSL